MALLDALLSPCQRLILQDVEQDVWLRLEGVEEGGPQEGLHVVPPCDHEGARTEDPRSTQCSRLGIGDQVVVLWCQAEALPEGPLRPPPEGNAVVACVRKAGSVEGPLCFEVVEELPICGHAIVLLHVGGPQEGVQGVEFETPLLRAAPLPSRMHALAVQNVIGTQQETRCQEFEERLELPMSSPEEHWRSLSAEFHQVVVEVFRFAEVLLEVGPC